MKEIFIRNKNIVSMTRLFNAAVIYPILGIDLGSQTTGVAVKFESSPTFPVGEITLNRKDNRAVSQILNRHFPVIVAGEYPKGNIKECSRHLCLFLNTNNITCNNVFYLGEAFTTISSSCDYSILSKSGQDSRAAALLIEIFISLLK